MHRTRETAQDGAGNARIMEERHIAGRHDEDKNDATGDRQRRW